MERLEFAIDAAKNAGNILKEYFKGHYAWREKSSPGDIVTEVDEKSESYLLSAIKTYFPNDAILSEESGNSNQGETEYAWIVDPLDGTRNYLQGIPFFSVSVGALKSGVPELGAVYDPVHDEMFYAQKGFGAYLNGKRISVGNETDFTDTLVSVSWVKHRADREKFVRYIEDLSRDTSYFRRFGSAALVLSYVACGRLSAFIQGGLSPWDVVAGAAIIQEAGGVISDFKGNALDFEINDLEVATANRALHKLMLERVIGVIE